MIALVTGADGLIGAQLVRFLKQKNWGVKKLETASGEFIDVRDAGLVGSKVAEVQPDVIFHLGGVSGPMVSADDPELVTATNAVGTVNVLEAARKNRVGRVVYAASLSGHDAGDEFGPVPGTVYGATKRFSELVASIYSHDYGLETVSARIGAVFGKDRQTIEVLDQMLIDARERRQVRYARHSIIPLISAHDVGHCLALLGEISDPPRNCDMYTQTLTEKRLAHMVAEAFGLSEASVVETRQKPPALPILTRIMYPHILLDDEVQLLPEALAELV